MDPKLAKLDVNGATSLLVDIPVVSFRDVLAQLSTGHGYSTYLGADEKSAAGDTTDIPIGSLVWVLRSKGRRKRREKEEINVGDDIATTSRQRLELFSRARVIANPSAVTRNGSDDVDHTTPTEAMSRAEESCVWVQYPKGSTYHVKRTHICRVLDKDDDQRSILVWPETDVYRKSCLMHTLPANEAFIEIGCDHGPTVDRVASALQDPSLALGIDMADDSIASARQRYPQYTFLQWDCLASSDNTVVLPVTLQTLLDRPDCASYNIAIDIGGNRPLPAVLMCLQRLLTDVRLSPRIVFVKSRELYHALLEERRQMVTVET